MTTSKIAIAAAVVLGAVAVSAAPPAQVLVVCSPGSAGSTDEAQPRMDAFAKALSAKAGTPIAAVYDPSNSEGAKRIENAGLAIVSLPFFLLHEKELGLHARLQVVQKGRPALERWALVAQKGRIKSAAALAGFTIASGAAFAPRFVQGVVSTLGTPPASLRLVESTAVLSSLRRAANGEAIAVLLDGAQEAALASLPFASKLEVVTRSPAMPTGLVVTVDARMSAAAWRPIEAALLKLGSDSNGAAGLAAIELDRFTRLDDAALAAARKTYASAP